MSVSLYSMSDSYSGRVFAMLGQGMQPKGGTQPLALARGAWHISPMQIDYDHIARTIAALTDGESDEVALMATVVCEVHHADDRFDWTGFYRVTAPEMLKIGPYQGGHGCLSIPFSRGVCGAAARTGAVQLVPDVDAFPGHIACASSTRSEIVLPVRDGAGRLIAVFDIDSDQPDAFTEEDAARLGEILAVVFGRI
jgi:GAF domain-containing protein